MQFRVDQRFPAPAPDVLAMYCDADFYPTLAGLPKIGPPEVLSRTEEDDGRTVHLRLRYTFVGDLPRAALAVLDPRQLTWVQDTVFDLGAAVSDARIIPDHYADRLTASARSTITAVDDETSARRVDGTVEVRMPFVGGQVEKAIVSGLREHLLGEQDRGAEWLAARRSTD